jgi:SAM-dependent methyltransferase
MTPGGEKDLFLAVSLSHAPSEHRGALCDSWLGGWTVSMTPHELRESVRLAYSAAADAPDAKHPFPVGAAFARDLGYPQELLRCLPDEAVEAFAGVSSVSIQAPLREGLAVIDLGCGAGLDSLIAAKRVGRTGCVVGIDFSAGMLDRANRAAKCIGNLHVAFVRASAEQLPLRDSSVDVALVNGIFNLNPFRDEIFRELGRVVRPGGHVSGAELVIGSPLPEHLKSGSANWFS